MSESNRISKAFVLGAGLGTRLRPLTDLLPKPLVPVWNAPLITYAFDHLMHDLGVDQFMINTHHQAGRYEEIFPTKTYRNASLEFRHEEVLLDTAGGIDNIRNWLPAKESFIVYNGDILTDFPLEQACETHHRMENLVTLVLRSGGDNCNVAFDPTSEKVLDLRNIRKTHSNDLYQFTGIYIVSPDFLKYIKPGEIESVVFPFINAIEAENRVGGAVVNQGTWCDLGSQPSYLESLSLLSAGGFPKYGLSEGKCRIHPEAKISETAQIDALSSVGPQAVVGDGAVLDRCVVWPFAEVSGGSCLTEEIVLPRAYS